MQRMMQADGGADLGVPPIRSRVPQQVQPKLKVSPPGDRYEREADRVADQVVQRAPSDGGGSAASPAAPSSYPLGEAQSGRTGGFGHPLDRRTQKEMGHAIGFDFSGVRVYTDEPAIQMSERLHARAFTHGSDIFFNRGEYDPSSPSGKRLLAHELTHVVQQSRAADAPARGMIQRTTVGNVLDEFFSPFSSETLWNMGASDNYTRIVRTWQPVIGAVNQAKAHLAANCATWSANHRTDTSWTPGKTDPPVTDPNAHGIWVSSPPGTDPDTCKNAFIIYVTSKAAPLIPTIQTFELYTCSIGSFGIYATVDSVDCAAQTAGMNIWMYNAMDQGSFGKYASHPAFALSGMERQYMWWNWTESHSWGAAAPSGGGSGGSNEWGG
jgi:hypothetical protein